MATLVSRGSGKIDKRYRPCRLSEVFGNENLVNSLNNWFSQGEKRSKVLLFQNGPGTGKTTLARILALGLNCEKNEGGEPCLECSSCKSILNGTALNIQEINAAQLNKKEDAEEIVSGMYESCLVGKNKIYILDECQQLTSSAQNLFLKPLEEPPLNTYFILCTTDPQKIIKPLQTRCQSFRVGNPRAKDLSDFLNQLFKLEGWSITKEDAEWLKETLNGCGFREIINIAEQYHLGGKESIQKAIVSEDPNLFELAMIVCSGKPNSFERFCQKQKEIESEAGFNCESFRLLLLGCLKTKLVKETNKEKQISIVQAMETIFEPYYENNPTPRMYANIFKVIYYL